jgi:hypothetical protein
MRINLRAVCGDIDSHLDPPCFPRSFARLARIDACARCGFLSGSCSGELGLRSFIDDARRGKIQKTYMPIQRIKALERLDMTTRGAMISLEEAAR